ncbi:MAG TPA: hypothetical protein VNF05_03105 [Acidimicrobiales bacterium]|nr:hypothetical protein [Acidimicrobiales bacterium]
MLMGTLDTGEHVVTVTAGRWRLATLTSPNAHPREHHERYGRERELSVVSGGRLTMAHRRRQA